MSQALPKIYLARHGQTEWSVSGQHTGLTDIPLTEEGKREALSLGKRLRQLQESKQLQVSVVYTSPLIRAKQTCKLAGFASQCVDEPDLVEWNYGTYEGHTTSEIRKERPDWNIFRDGCPDGETLSELGTRADRFVARLREAKGDVIVFSHGHFLRFLAASWLGQAPSEARFFLLSTASLSILGYEHNKYEEPVIHLWNDNLHVKC
jgi:probable phosphoglycerate mutase